ncbi:glycosyl hydrolase-related protein, partial [Thomasclavelia ramosa]
FRTYGFMGKENLVYRPGRASGERIIATPAAQLLKEMDFKLGFTTFNCDINNANIDTLAKEYNTPIEVYEYADFLNGRLIFAQEDEEQILPVTNSLFESENNLVVSAIKKSEDGEGYIIRLFNGKDHQDIGDKLTFNFDISEAYYTNLKEEKIEQIDVVDNSVVIKSISHCKFITILIK